MVTHLCFKYGSLTYFKSILLILFLHYCTGHNRSRRGFRDADEVTQFDLEDHITRAGYAAEVHDVVTEDGFIIGLHRIPYRFNGLYEPEESEKWNRPTVLLVHGTTQSAFDFLAIGNNSLGYILNDVGYDVWLMNCRGTIESSRHTKYTVKDREYWDWSTHEMALYDLSAVIDYILEVKQQASLFYVGYSNGNVLFYMLMSLRPEYNYKIRLMLTLGPTLFQHDFPNGLDLVLPAAQGLLTLGYKIGDHILRPDKLFKIPRFYASIVCSTRITSIIICQTIAGALFGFDYSMTNSTNFGSVILPRAFNPVSSKMMLHWTQLVTSRRFQKFDYGSARNQELYDKSKPPEYDLSRVISPVAIFWANNDYGAHPKTATRLASRLPNVVYNRPVPYKKFNHLDFVYGEHAGIYVYDRMIELMRMY